MTHIISNMMDLTNAPTPPRWFEFLLEPGKLQQHLGTNGCDPSPTQLISLFFRNIPIIDSNINQSPCQRNGSSPLSSNGNTTQPSPSVSSASDEVKTPVESVEKVLTDSVEPPEIDIPSNSYEAKYRYKKSHALQMLSIKVASHLKWDLDVICSNLTIPTQHKLLQALNNTCSTESCPMEVKKFATLIYCQWFLRSAITFQLSTLQPASNNTTIIYLSQLQQQQQTADTVALSSMGELFLPHSKQLKSMSEELHSFIIEQTRNKDNTIKRHKSCVHSFKKVKLSRPTIDCFDLRDEKFNNWQSCEPIDSVDYLESACYDLGRFFFFEESYALAKETFEIINSSNSKFPMLEKYLKSASDILSASGLNEELNIDAEESQCDIKDSSGDIVKQVEEFLDEVTEDKKDNNEGGTALARDLRQEAKRDLDLRIQSNVNQNLIEDNPLYLQVPADPKDQQILEAAKGDAFMSQGDFGRAMGCFVGAIMLMTDYFRKFSANYTEEEPYITRMIQCSIYLSCFTQAVALCQMTKSLNYTIAFKQLNERICNDCCDDIYECIWNVTLLEYIINLHTKRGEVERRAKVIQLIGQLELNENNPEEILKEAEHVRRGRFFRIMSNKYL